MTQKQICLFVTATALAFVSGLGVGVVVLRTPASALLKRISTLESELQSTINEHQNKSASQTKEKTGLETELKSAKKGKTRLEIDLKSAKAEQERLSQEVTALEQQQPDSRDTLIKDMISTGVIHSVNIEYNQVRVDPTIWKLSHLEVKQNMVLFFSEYFKDHESTGRVTILSNRNDSKLATYSVWSGVKILQ